MATKADLARAVLLELTVIDPHDTADAADTQTVIQRIDNVRAWLIDEGLCYWTEDAIPAAAMEPLTVIVAARAASAFGKKYDGLGEGLRMLARHVQTTHSNEPARAAYF